MKEGAQEGGEERGVGVCEGVFVEVVDVGEAEVKGGEEDKVGGSGVGEEVEGEEGGAEGYFFGCWALRLSC